MKSVILFGDSITFGRGAKLEKSWAFRLKKLVEEKKYHSVFNLGIPGNTSDTLLERFETELNARASYNWPGDWHTVVISIGINDTRGIDKPDNVEVEKEKFSSNLNKIVEIAKKVTSRILLVGLTPVNEELTNPYENTFFTNKRISEYNSEIKSIAHNHNVPFVDVFDIMLAKKDTVDGLHPNEEGYDILFNHIIKGLTDNKLLEDSDKWNKSAIRHTFIQQNKTNEVEKNDT